MYKAVIVDDEKHCSEGLKLQLEDLNTGIQVIASFNDPVEALHVIPTLDIDLLFLDIQMPHMNGLTLASRLHPLSYKIVFTTAFDKFAIQAFRVSAFDYLLKPIRDEDILLLLDRIKMEAKEQNDIRLKLLMGAYSPQSPSPTKIAVPTRDGYELITADEISHCIARSNYTEITLSDGKSILVSRTLKETAQILEDFGFLRLHQSHILHPQYVKTINRGGGGSVTMITGEELPLSREGRSQLLENYKMINRQK